MSGQDEDLDGLRAILGSRQVTPLSLAREAITRVLRGHEPYPALVLDRRWNVVMTNRAADPFLAGAAAELLRPPINLVRLALHPRGLASRLVNLVDVRAMLRMRITRQLAISPDVELTKLYEELLLPDAADTPSQSLADVGAAI